MKLYYDLNSGSLEQFIDNVSNNENIEEFWKFFVNITYPNLSKKTKTVLLYLLSKEDTFIDLDNSWFASPKNKLLQSQIGKLQSTELIRVRKELIENKIFTQRGKKAVNVYPVESIISLYNFLRKGNNLIFCYGVQGKEI